MDDSGYDIATQRLSRLLSHRRSLVVLAGLGLSAGILADDADARHKKHNNRKKKFCKCSACSRCVKGKCKPVADGTACGTNGVCSHNVCAVMHLR